MSLSPSMRVRTCSDNSLTLASSVRLEIGPRDVQNNSVVAARRDVPGKEGKRSLSQEGLVAALSDLLNEIQANMLKQATVFRDANLHDVKTYDEFKQVIEAGGFARGGWNESPEDEARIKEETGASHRCYPLDQPKDGGVSFYTGKPAQKIAIFAKAY